ncbi:Ig-like domain-containing protein [Pragia fontium]|uniref:Ig-like domain (Group 3) n=1 Tax=Pragia fontium DSM 5563 = ATCC 49100 TaxID=1122977 RepID=A0AAJ4WAB2_9GAMM|nr:Ig-like domain-containing protein [Pragia fontium]SFC75487.1 Ig-like domain (group 3) [Pragia fontium DSM 5563 = ATCC 49100]
MAQENNVLGTVDVVAQGSGAQLAHYSQGSRVITLTQSSVVKIHGNPDLVASYERQGDDLIVHMKDGSTVRYQRFFFLDQNGEHSELIFVDDNEAYRAIFPLADLPGPATAEAISPTYAAVTGSLFEGSDLSAGALAGILAALAVGAGVAIAAGTGGGGGGGHSSNNDGGGVAEPKAPTVKITALGGDDKLNQADVQVSQLITGTTTNVEAGQTVTVTLNGKTYTTQVAADGSWQVSVPAADLQNLAQGTGTIQVSVSNQAGQTGQDSHAITVDTVPPTVTISAFAGDNILDSAERSAFQIISGTAVGAEGRTVTITLGSKTYTAVVDAEGHWTTSVSSVDLQGLADGNYTLSAKVSDAAGNSATANESITVVSTEPAISINTFAGDDIINSAESKTGQVLSGDTVNVESGSAVRITISNDNPLTRIPGGSNSQTFLAEVDLDGTWHIVIPPGSLEQLFNGPHTITAVVTNGAGQTAESTHTITVDTSLSGIAIDIVSSDDYLSATEATQVLAINGVTSGVPAGTHVTVMLNGKSYDAVVDVAGNWSVGVPPADLKLLADGVITVTATVVSSGNTYTADHPFTVLTHQSPQPTLNSPFGDGILNLAESGVNQIISGTTGITGAGQSVVVTLGGVSYVAFVNAAGQWSVLIPAKDLQALSDGNASLSVKVTDVAGNPGELNGSVVVDTTAPTLAVKAFAGDNILTASEETGGQILSGSASIADHGKTVMITLNGVSYQATVGIDGSWSVNIPATDLQKLSDGSHTINMSLTDAAGNTTQTTLPFDVKNSLPTLAIHTFAGDDILNNVEAKVNQTLSGTTTNAETGSLITVVLNGQVYTTHVLADGSWSIILPAAELSVLSQGNTTIQVSVTDLAGQTVQSSHDFTVVNGVSGIAINTVAGDDYLNQTEAQSPVMISGSTSQVNVGQPVTITLNGKEYIALVLPDGSWQAEISPQDLSALQDGTATITVSVIDQHGNTLSSSHDFNVLTHTLPDPSINTPFGDNVLNALETQSAQLLSGTTGISGAGQTVVVHFNNVDYNAIVDVNGNWSLSLSPSQLQQISEGPLQFGVTVTDIAGNQSEVVATTSIDTLAPVLTVNPFTGDDRINIAEAQIDQTLSGTAIGAEAGQTVDITLNGKHYSAIVDASGNWSVNIPGADLQALPDGNLTIQLSVADKAGNQTTSQHDILSSGNPLYPPVISIDSFASNDVLDGAEQQTDQWVRGVAYYVETGQTVTLTFDGKTYQGVVDATGHWAIKVPSADLALLSDGSYTLQASVSDLSGNIGIDSHNIIVNTQLGSLAVNAITGDDLVNLSEAELGLTISGTSVGVPAGTNNLTIMLNGKTYVTSVLANGTWSYHIPAIDAQAIADGGASVVVSALNDAGNPVSSTHDFTVITHALPDVTMNTPFGDGVLNLQEANSVQTLSGSTGVLGNGQSVTVNIGGQDYTGTVDSQGNWSVTLPAGSLALVDNGQLPITVTVNDITGNSDTLVSNVQVDKASPSLNVNDISGDNTINAAEALAPIEVSGTASLDVVGQTVSITLPNGMTYTGVVGVGGIWSITIPAGDLSNIPDGQLVLTASISDPAGNTTTLDVPVQLNASAANQPTIHVNITSGDDYINAAESQLALVISGTTIHVAANQQVTITLNGKTYQADVLADGSWSYNVPAEDVQQLPDGKLTINATVNDTSGNVAQGSRDVTVITDAENLPQIQVNVVADDDVINAQEAQSTVTISGTTQNVTEGQTVTVTLHNVTYTAIVDASGNWSVDVPADQIQDLPQGAQNITVQVSDVAENSVSTTHGISVDTLPPLLEVDVVADNNILNFVEASLGQILSGMTEPGLTVHISINGAEVAQVTADGTGHWQLEISGTDLLSLPQGANSIELSVTDAAGNTSTLPIELLVGTSNLPTLTLDQPFTDGLLNIAEATAGGTLTGLATNLPANTAVNVMIGNQSFTGTVDADGHWSVSIPENVLLSLADGTTSISVTASDSFGNEASANGSLVALVNLSPIAEITTPLFIDNILNLAEATSGQILTGNSGLVGAGQTVLITLDGQTYTGTVDNLGNWSVPLPPAVLLALADSSHSVSVTLSDAAGNTTVSAPVNFSADTHNLPSLHINVISEDNYINANEAQAKLVISGTTTFVEADQQVTILLNGKTYTATVQADGRWSYEIPAEDVLLLPDGPLNINASVTDTGGNPAQDVHVVTVIATAANLPQIFINAVAENDIINQLESQSSVTISGFTHNVSEGQIITITLNGIPYPIAVDALGHWSVNVSATDVQNLPQGSQNISVQVSDIAGNDITVLHAIQVDTLPPLLSVSDITLDNVLNLAAALAGQVLSGTTDAGLTVNITINGVTTQVTADGSGHWQLSLSAAELLALPQGDVSIGLSVTDSAGNTTTTALDLTIATGNLPTLTLDQPFTDGLLNIAEATAGGSLSGLATNLAANTPISVTIGNQQFSGIVTADGHWSVNIPAGALLLLADGLTSISVTAADSFGNPASANGSLTALVHLQPTASLSVPLFIDNVLNLAEATVGQVLTGTSGLVGGGQSVFITLDGQQYPGLVDALGNWTVLLPPATLLALADSGHTISVTLTDAAGNTTTSTGVNFTSVIHTLPAPTLDLPFTDGILNFSEASSGGELTGSTHITGAGQTVTISINGVLLTADVDNNGNWSLPLDSATLLGLPDGTWPITITATDSAGNKVSVVQSVDVLTHTLPNATINTPFVDGLLSIAEANAVGGQVISGNTGITGAGQTVVVTIDGVPQTVVVLPTGQWSVALDSTALNTLGGGSHDIHVSVTDSAGNNSQQDLSFNSLLTAPTPVINLPFGDGILNLSEAGQIAIVTGITGIVGGGQGVTLKVDLNGITYPATVDVNGNWSVSIPANALSALGNGTHSLSVTATDAAGNSTTVSQSFSTQFTLPQPTLATPFDDSYLNISEASSGQTITGLLNVVGDPTKATVTVTVGGVPHTATVYANGTWSLDLSSSDLITLGSGDKAIVVSVTDEALNTNSTTSYAHFSLTPPTITVNPFAGDNTLNYAESQQTQILSGMTTNVEFGQTVTIMIGGKSFTTTVGLDGSWSLAIAPVDLATLTSGTINVSVEDIAGNSAAAPSVNLTVNNAVPTPFLTLDPVAVDNAFNLTESLQPSVTISGTAALSMIGETVTLTLGGLIIPPTIIGLDGRWSITIPGGIALLPDGVYTLTATATSLLVETASTSTSILVDRIPPTLTVGTFAGNDVLNGTEAASAQILSGTGSEIGSSVTITLNGHTYHAVIQANGSWSVPISSADLSSLPQGTQNIVVTLVDKAGNVTTVPHPITVDTVAPLLSVDVLGVGDVLTAAEILLGLPLGGKGNPGDTVTVKLGPLTLTALVDGNGDWHVNFPTLQLQTLVDGPQVINVSVGDAAGNVTSVNIGLDVALNSSLGAGVDDVFGSDGILNLVESLLTQTLTGTATGDYNGAVVSVTLLGQTFTANVGNNGKWSINLTPDLWQGLTANTLDLDFSITDANGNVVNQIVHTKLALTDLPIINSIVAFEDNFLNQLEAGASQLISGTIGNMAPGTTVSVTLGTKTYTNVTVDANGSWSVSIPPLDLAALQDGLTKVSVAVTDAGGNVVQQSIDLGVITHNLPVIHLNPLFGDGILSLNDLLGALSIGGTATGLAGQVIDINIAGVPTLNATVGSDGSWSVALTPSVIQILQGLGSGNITVSVTANDVAGNPATASAGLKLDLLAPVLDTISLFDNGLLNALDATTAQVISGTVANAPEGSTVSVALGGKIFTALTLANGTFQITVQPSDLTQLPDGSLTANITITTPDGNTNTIGANLLVGLKNLPVVTLDSLFDGDGFLNQAESAVAQLISGKVTNLTSGTIQVNVGGNLLNATINPDGTWSTSVSGSILSLLPDGPLNISATVTDAVGNTNTASASLSTIIHNLPTISIGSIFGDGLLGVGDLLTSQLISGTVTNLTAGTQLTITLGGSTYQTTVDSNGKWSLSIAPLDLQGLLDGNLTVGVSAKDAAGNTASASAGLQVSIHALPTLTLDSIFSDGGLNANDILSAQVISGHSTNAAGSTVQVTLAGVTYSATVAADGSWALSVPSSALSGLADGNFNIGATLTNVLGNVASTSGVLDVITQTLPNITLGSIFGGDGFLNISEAGIIQTLGGTVTNAAGGSVTVTLGTTNYNATVNPDGTWSLNLPPSVLDALNDGTLHVGVTVTDKVGNSKTIDGGDIVVKLNPPLLSYNPLTTLNISNLLTKGLTIGGGSLNLLPNSEVKISLLNIASVTARTDANGNWSATLSLTLLQLLSLNLLTPILELSAQDQAGNIFEATLGLGTALTLPAPEPTLLAAPMMESLVLDTSTDSLNTTTNNSLSTSTSSLAPEDNTSSGTQTTSTSTTFTIGGVTIDLADGSHNSGESVQGSSGNDVIHLSSLGFTSIDGGTGIDTLILEGSNMNLDLTQLAGKIAGIEIFDLGSGGNNSITLDLQESLTVKDTAQDQLLIKGSAGDQVNLVHGQGDIWNVSGQSVVNGVIYDVYHNSSQGMNTLGDVLVQQGLHVNLV